MKRTFTIVLAAVMLVIFMVATSQAAKREKFGTDPRTKIAKRVKFEPSQEKFRWKMVMPWSKGLLFYDMAVHFADSVRLASAGRLDIKPMSAGELVPANQTFDAVSEGSAEIGHASPIYWKGKDEAFVALASVPFGLDGESYSVWLQEGGGQELADELYGKFNIKPIPCGQAGQEMGIFSNKRAVTPLDFKGMKVRTVGWYMDILNSMGVSATPLPGGEVYLALERGVIDGAEYSAPAINYPMGFDDITKYAIQPGVHQPGFQCFVIINKDAYAKLPEDLKWIVDICAAETNAWSYNWIQKLNAEAMEKFKEKIEIVQMDKDTRMAFRKATKTYLDGVKAKFPNVKKILDSQESFLKDFEVWRDSRSGVAPWTYETYMGGRTNE